MSRADDTPWWAAGNKVKPDGDPSPRLNTSFWLTGECFDPRDFTKIVEMVPTDHGVRGQIRTPRPPVPETFWRLSLEGRRCYEIDEALAELLDLLWPKREAIRSFAKSTGAAVGFDTNVTILEDRPVYSLSPRSLSRMAYLGADYGLDIFDYSD